jgi:hypothetical protein
MASIKPDTQYLLSCGAKIFPASARTKSPLIRGWQDVATDDPAIIAGWAREYRGCAWGVACGPSGLHVVDIDGAHGELSVLDKDLPPTLEVQTQSGNRHLYYIGATASRNRALPGVDIKSAGGLVIAAGSIGYRIINRVTPVAAPSWSVDLVGAPSAKTRSSVVLHEDNAEDIERARRWLAESAAPSIEGEGGNDNAYRVACRVRDFGVSPGRCLDMMMGAWNDKCEPPWDFGELGKIVDNAYQYSLGPQGEASLQEDFGAQPPDDTVAALKETEPPPLLDRLNARHAKMAFGGKIIIWVAEVNGDGTREFKPYPTQEFDKLYEHRNVQIESAGGEVKTVPVGRWWRTHPKHMRCSRIVLDPTLPSGPTGQDGPFNLWRGWKVQPKAGDWSDYNRLITEALCAGDKAHADYVMDWIAFLFQKPTELHKVALVFRGEKGTGKSTLGLALKIALGGHSAKADTAKAIVGGFNWHLRDKVFLLAEEVRWMQDREGEGTLKSLITDPERSYEAKGLNIVNGSNHVSLMITTNDDWAVPASADERRFAVFDVAPCLRADKALWNRLYERGTLRQAPIAALMHAMMDRDITGFDPAAHAPKTQALVEQAMESMDYIDRWWLDRLSNGQAPGISEDSWSSTDLFLSATEVYDDFAASLPRGRHIPSNIALGRRLHKYGVSRARRRGDNGLVWGYGIPILHTAREIFAGVYNADIRW